MNDLTYPFSIFDFGSNLTPKTIVWFPSKSFDVANIENENNKSSFFENLVLLLFCHRQPKKNIDFLSFQDNWSSNICNSRPRLATDEMFSFFSHNKLRTTFWDPTWGSSWYARNKKEQFLCIIKRGHFFY